MINFVFLVLPVLTYSTLKISSSFNFPIHSAYTWTWNSLKYFGLYCSRTNMVNSFHTSLSICNSSDRWFLKRLELHGITSQIFWYKILINTVSSSLHQYTNLDHTIQMECNEVCGFSMEKKIITTGLQGSRFVLLFPPRRRVKYSA